MTMVENVQPAPREAALPFLKWAGGKRQLLPLVLERIAPHRTYYEPFLGGGAVFFGAASRIGRAVLGDANAHLLRAYEGVRTDVGQVVDMLKAMEASHSTAYYYATRELDPWSLDGARAAAWMIYLNKTCFNGLWRVNAKGVFNVPVGRPSSGHVTICDEPVLRAASTALACASLRIGDFEETVRTAREGDFVYFDPPYVPLSPSSDFDRYTPGGFGMGDHERLRDCARRLRVKGVSVLLSNADVPVVRSLYDGFAIESVEANRSVGARVRGRVMEVLIS